MTRRLWMLALAAGLVLVAIAAAVVWRTGTPPPATDGRAGVPVPARGAAAAPAQGWRVDYHVLDQRIAALMREPDMVGLAVGAVENGQISFLKGYGEVRAGSGVAVTPDTVFRWASLSKSVAAALVVGLAGEGRFALDAPVAEMGTTLTVPGGVARVTVADLLSHRLGLVRNAWDDRLEAGEDPRSLRAALGTLPPFCPPGTCYAYQNIAFDAASEIVERFAGHSYADVARARLFAPLGMTHASIGRAALMAEPRWAQPHRNGRRPVAVEEPYYRVPAAGGVNSSILDLALWLRAQVGAAPSVLSPGMLDTMHRPRVTTPPHGRRGPMDRALTNASYGLGWRSFDYAGHRLVGHRGSVDGYGSLILFDPALRSGIVMLWNSNQYKAARLQLEFFDLLYGRPRTDWLELTPAAAVPVAR